MPKINCPWCNHTFFTIINKDKKGERNILTCPNCTIILPSSKKDKINNLIGRKHIHREYKDGDIAI